MFFATKSIKQRVDRYIEENAEQFRGKVVLDFPAGSGHTASQLLRVGAKVEAFDLFPQWFQVEGASCERVDLMQEPIPRQDNYADLIICQEGIEHFSDQALALREFNRVLKPGGRLLVTTPSYSSAKARFSYMLGETENFKKFMPPNELDSVWMSQGSDQLYYGHIFLIGYQKLRTLAKLAGLDLVERVPTYYNPLSLVLTLLFYPWMWLSARAARARSLAGKKGDQRRQAKALYREQNRLNLSFQTLLDNHIFAVFEKQRPWTEVAAALQGKYHDFNQDT